MAEKRKPARGSRAMCDEKFGVGHHDGGWGGVHACAGFFVGVIREVGVTADGRVIEGFRCPNISLGGGGKKHRQCRQRKGKFPRKKVQKAFHLDNRQLNPTVFLSMNSS